MATFQQRDSGYWQAIIRRKGYPRQSQTFPTKNLAEQWARDIENKIDRGIFIDRTEAENTSLAVALARYLREVTPKKKGASAEKFRIEFWMNYKPLASKSLANIRSSDIAEYRDNRLDDGVAPATIRNDLAVISHLYTVAFKDWGMAVENPVKGARLPRANNARNRRLVKDEESRILEAFDHAEKAGGGKRTNHKIRRAFVFAVETAMRQGELLSLDWRFVDLEQRVLLIPKSKNDEGRYVPLSTLALASLEALKNKKNQISGSVFNMTKSALDQSWRRCVMRARRTYEKEMLAAGMKQKDLRSDTLLQNLTWHDLRHEGTSRLAEKLAMHELMKVTGHKDARMLARYYHPRASDLAKKLG